MQAEDFELYDLLADPLETHDVLAENPREVRRLRAALMAWMERTALASSSDAADGDDPAAVRALKAMGYIP